MKATVQSIIAWLLFAVLVVLFGPTFGYFNPYSLCHRERPAQPEPGFWDAFDREQAAAARQPATPPTLSDELELLLKWTPEVWDDWNALKPPITKTDMVIDPYDQPTDTPGSEFGFRM